MIRNQDYWLLAIRRYFAVIAGGNLVWEFAQFPLYTLWWEGTPGEILFAALHCTGGDILIAGTALLGSILLLGTQNWPNERYIAVAALTISTGVAYTIFSEWLNIEIRRSWAYTDTMPTIPLIEAGLAPLAQWIVIPALAFWWAGRPPHFRIRQV